MTDQSKDKRHRLADCRSWVDDAIGKMHSGRVGANSEWYWNYVESRREHFVSQLAFISDLIDEASTIIDYGAAPFVVDQALALMGHDVTAVDLDPYRFDNVDRLDLTIVACDIEAVEDLAAVEIESDLAILSHVFKHLRIDIIQTLKGIDATMHPGALLYLETPNLLSLSGWNNLLRKRIAYSTAGSPFHEWSKIERLGHMGHVREYTAAELIDILKGCEFHVNEVCYQGSIKPVSVKRRLLKKLQDVRPSLRENIRIVARKPDVQASVS